MEINLNMKYYPGVGDRPRPALRVSARAHRRGPGGVLEEFIHTTLVDANEPTSWVEALDRGIKIFTDLRAQRNMPLDWFRALPLEEQAFRMVG